MSAAALAAIRPARSADADAVEALLAEAELPGSFEAEEFLVAEDEDDVVGCVRLHELSSGGHELASLVVAPARRGQGLGTRLVEAAVAQARGPVHALALAGGFFADVGFRRVDEVHPDLRAKHEQRCALAGAVPMVAHPDEEAWRQIEDRYGAIAESEAPAACCQPASPYPEEVLAAIPDGAERGLGTGDPVGAAEIQPGDTVVDLGSGAGVDVFAAALAVGPEGEAIGVDVTSEMVAKARSLAEEHGFENAGFLEAPIEALPLDDGVADVVVSNCVINLSPDKPAALAEAHRVLRPGGRFVLSDTLRVDGDSGEAGGGCGCVEGAWTQQAWREGLADADFEAIEVDVEEPTGRFGPDVGTATVWARKPA